MAGRKPNIFELDKQAALDVARAQYEWEHARGNYEAANIRRRDLYLSLCREFQVSEDDYDIDIARGLLVRKQDGKQS